MTVRDWFHDTLGKFSGEAGAAILEIYLLRRETALGQIKLLRKRRRLKSQTMASAKEIVSRRREQSNASGRTSPGSKAGNRPKQSAA